MTDTRQALEGAYEAIYGMSVCAALYRHGSLGEEPSAEKQAFVDRFYRFLDAEAWTDAAMMLIPDNWTAWEMRSHAGRSHFSVDLSRLSECDAGQEDWAHGRGMHPALALAQAALRAKEAGHG